MRILELGSYIVPAYAGQILQEQGHEVTKWWTGQDPILSLRHGRDLWDLFNEGKHLVIRRFGDADLSGFDAVLDNIRPETWERWGIDPAVLAARLGIPWVSMRPDVPGRSFDVIAQARSWMGHGVPWVPIYVGDTAGGLWLAFKLLALAVAGRVGHHPIYQASVLQKLVDGELRLPKPRVDASGQPCTPWDIEPYGATSDGAVIEYRGETITEPVRDLDWRLQHLHHDGTGRITV
jgi:hypothetical protein